MAAINTGWARVVITKVLTAKDMREDTARVLTHTATGASATTTGAATIATIGADNSGEADPLKLCLTGAVLPETVSKFQCAHPENRIP